MRQLYINSDQTIRDACVKIVLWCPSVERPNSKPIPRPGLYPIMIAEEPTWISEPIGSQKKVFVDKQVQNVRFPLIPFICSFSFPVLLLTVSLRSYTLQVIESRCPLQQVPRLFRRFNHRKCYQKVKHSNNMIIITTDSSLVTKHITTIGTLRSNDEDGEENVKKKNKKKQ